MTNIPLVRVAALSPYLAALDALGIPVQPLLERVKLPERHRLQPDSLIGYKQGIDLMVAAYRTTELRRFPDVLFQRAQVDCLGSWGRVLSGARTLGDLLDLSVRTSRTHASGDRLWLENRGSTVLWCHEIEPRMELRQGEGVYLLVLGYMMSALRGVLGATWSPEEFTLPAPFSFPVDCLGIDATVRMSRVTSIAIPRTLLATPTRRIMALAGGDDAHVLERLSESAPASDLAGSVRQALRLLTCAGHPDLQALAEIARLPVRTLQRRLSESGLSFRSLVQESQLADALRLMQDPSLKLIDVAFELGFSDPAHFTRAFRRWTGVSPRAFRRLGSPARAENAPIFTGIRSAGAKGQEPIDRRQHPMRQAAP